MEWSEIRSQKGVDDLMRATEHFHDWYLAGFTYDPLATSDSDSKNLARFVSETSTLSVLLRYDSTDKNGDWPELEIEFSGVYHMSFHCFEPDPFCECWLGETARGWVFVNDGPLTDDERAQPDQINAALAVVSSKVRWRVAGGTLRTDKQKRGGV